jgi:biotin carboxyl carrier protein
MSPGSGRQVTVIVNGTAYLVEVGDPMTWPTMVTVNGRPYQVAIESAHRQSSEAQSPATGVQPTTVEPAGPTVAQPPSPAAAASSSGFQVTAPMPGNILGLAVRPGERVRVGQELCSLEAMKMRNAIRSSREGVIARVEVTEGQTVAYGDVLFTFE